MQYTKFRGNRMSVPEEKIFKGFLPYMGMVAILVMPSDFYFLVPESYHKKIGLDRQSSF